MSYEAWGDSPEPATQWEQTAICQEFGLVNRKFQEWKLSNCQEIGETDEIKAMADAIEEKISDLVLFMEGEL